MTRVKFLVAVIGALVALSGGPNDSSDGRYHTCGYVSVEGVTSYLGDYSARCD